MSIIPKDGEEKEPISLLGVLAAQYILGLGILYIGSATKNKIEFWGGFIVFLIIVGLIILGLFDYVEYISYAFFGLFSISAWSYLILRLIYIYVKKITKIKLI